MSAQALSEAYIFSRVDLVNSPLSIFNFKATLGAFPRQFSTLLIVNRQSLIVNCQKALLYAFALHKLHNYSLTLPKNFT